MKTRHSKHSWKLPLTKKIQPRYHWSLPKTKAINILFVTSDLKCLQYIQACKDGLCLFFDNNIEANRFNLSFCYQLEVWVLYSDDYYHGYSLDLGRAIQHAGAKSVQIVPFPIFMGGNP